MTVSSATNEAAFQGNGVTQIFPLPFRFFSNSDIIVELVSEDTGSVTPQTIGTHYTLSGAGDPEIDGNATGELTMLSPVAVGFSLFVRRELPLTQPTDIINQGRYFPEIHETVFDRLLMQIQQGIGSLGKALRVIPSEPNPAFLPLINNRANRLLSFDSEGNPIAVAPASGDASELAIDLANSTDPEKGSSLVGRPGGTVSDLFSSDAGKGSYIVPYLNRSVGSRLSDTAHIFDFIPESEHAAIIAGTSTYDAVSDFHAAISEVGEGSTIWLPHRGTIRTSSVTVDKFGITFAGENTGAGYYSSRIQGIQDGAPVFNVTQPQFSLIGVALEGLSNTTEKGADITQDGVRLSAPTQADNLDAVFINSSFTYLRDCIDMRGRNVRVINSLFSNSRSAVNIPSLAISDVRGLELYSNRYHSLGKLGAADSAVVVVAPTANFMEVIMTGGEADDCVSLYRGFSGNSKISVPCAKGRGDCIFLDSTLFTLPGANRLVTVDLTYNQSSAASIAGIPLRAVGDMNLVANVNIASCGAHGVVLDTSAATLTGKIEGVGQFANNTYDGVLIQSNSTNVNLSGLTVGQDQTIIPVNKARYGVNDSGFGTNFSGVNVVGTFGTSRYLRGITSQPSGDLPNRPDRVSISWGTTMPTSGTFIAGSIHWRSNPTVTGAGGSQYVVQGWKRLTSGTGHVLNTDWVEMRMPTGT